MRDSDWSRAQSSDAKIFKYELLEVLNSVGNILWPLIPSDTEETHNVLVKQKHRFIAHNSRFTEQIDASIVRKRAAVTLTRREKLCYQQKNA